MKQVWKRVAALGLALSLALGLSACKGGSSDVDNVTTMVQGNLDEIYQGKYDPEYLKLVGSTESESEEAYLAGLEVEAEYFTYYWGILDASYNEQYEDLDQDLRDEIVALYKDIYSHSKYTVEPAVKQSDGNFTVKVTVEAIDVMQQASDIYDNDSYEPLNQFYEKLGTMSAEEMTDEQYAEITNEYGHIIVQLVKDQMPNLGHLEAKNLSIQVEKGEDGAFAINDDDWERFDTMVIEYP